MKGALEISRGGKKQVGRGVHKAALIAIKETFVLLEQFDWLE